MTELKKITADDLGITEDEFSNFLIDIWSDMNGKRNPETKKFQYFDAVTGEVVESSEPISVTISIPQ